jgi:serine/threonine-protein phosphatase PPG1
MKIKYPQKIHLLRGNHESRATNQQYGFHLECLKKYNQSITVWLYINEMFNYLPLAAVIDNKLFCIHGGLSPLLQSVEDIKNLERCRDIPTEGVMADLVWSDPDQGIEGFKLSERGAGFIFGENVIDKFLHVNKFETIIRAHQLCMDGYSILFNGKIITVWSAPKYCGRFDNCASIMEVDENLDKYFNIFEDAETSSGLQNEEKKKQMQYFNPAMEKYFQ